MNTTKRLMALLLAFALLCTMAACTAAPKADGNATPDDGNGANEGDAANATPSEIVAAAMEKMSATKSMDAVMEMEMEMSSGEESFVMTTTMDMTTFTDPIKLRADVKMDMGALGAMDMTLYAQGEGDNYTMYVYDGANWAAQNVSLSDLEQYSAQSSMDIYLNGAVDFVAAGTEELAGGTADKYTGVIRGEALEKLLLEGNAMDSLTSTLGEDAETLKDIYKDLGDLPISIWVDQESGYVVRFGMDMSDLMSKIMEKIVETEDEDIDISITKMAITMSYANLDAATDFEIPAEALNAA